MRAVGHQPAPAPHDRIGSAGGTAGINPREIAIARRAVAQEAIRLANSGQIQLKEAEDAKDGEAAA